jgi:hypothetical protein
MEHPWSHLGLYTTVAVECFGYLQIGWPGQGAKGDHLLRPREISTRRRDCNLAEQAAVSAWRGFAEPRLGTGCDDTNTNTRDVSRSRIVYELSFALAGDRCRGKGRPLFDTRVSPIRARARLQPRIVVCMTAAPPRFVRLHSSPNSKYLMLQKSSRRQKWVSEFQVPILANSSFLPEGRMCSTACDWVQRKGWYRCPDGCSFRSNFPGVKMRRCFRPVALSGSYLRQSPQERSRFAVSR